MTWTKGPLTWIGSTMEAQVKPREVEVEMDKNKSKQKNLFFLLRDLNQG